VSVDRVLEQCVHRVRVPVIVLSYTFPRLNWYGLDPGSQVDQERLAEANVSNWVFLRSFVSSRAA